MSIKKDREFGSRVKHLREGYKLSQKEAAEKIGVSYSAYQRYESGGMPSKRNLDRLISFYGCSESWLILGDGNIYPERVWDSNTQIERLKGFCNIDSDEQFAAFLGVYKKTIDHIRNNNEPIPDSWYFKISNVTNISYDRLSFGVGPKHRSNFEKKLHDSTLEEEEMVSSMDISPIDEEWIKKIVVRLEEELEKMNCSLSPTWKAFVITSSYESFWNNKKADLKVVDTCISLALKGEKEMAKG